MIDSYIKGGAYDGGLVGYIESGAITNSYNIGSVTGGSSGSSYIGGLSGRSVSITITSCYNTGSISTKGSYIGGLVGRSDSSTITKCCNKGSIVEQTESSSYVGGLVGGSYGSSAITNCYNMGSVNSDYIYVGGIGYDNPTGAETTTWMKNATATTTGWDTAVWSFVSNEYPQLYGIGLSQTDPYTFTAQTVGYSSVSPLSVTVSNAGNQTTGDLTVALTGDNAANFTLSKTAVSSIAEGYTDTFTIAPNTGLTAGTYTATVTVSGSSVTSQTFTVSFTVNPKSSVKAITGFTLSGVSGTINEAYHTIAVTLPYGTDITSLTPTIMVSAKASVSPASGTAQNFTSSVVYTVKAENESTQTYTVTVTVNPINTYSIALSQTDPYTFTSQTVGYSSVTPLSVTASNTGNQATGDLIVALTGTGKDSFTLSKTTISSIAASGTNNFTIKPNDSLAAGAYTATVTVSGGNSISMSFTVSFTVSSGSAGGNSGSSGGSGSSSKSNIIVTTENNITTASQTFTASTGSNGVATASVTTDQIADMIKAASEKAQEQHTQKALEIKVDSGTSATGVSVTIPQVAASSLKDGVNALTIASPTVTVTFDEKALAEIGKNGDITVKAIKLAS